MERWHGKVAIVTGASSGIGLATAKALVHEGMVVIGLARRLAQMEYAMKDVKDPNGKGKFHGYQCDISKEDNVEEAFKWIQKNFGVAQVLVNNAGVGKMGTLEETSTADWERIFSVNVMGLLMCTKRMVAMVKQADVEGHIININSILGHRVYHIPDITLNVYPASKFAVTALSENLVKELCGGKIRVTNLSPGPVKTEILEVSGAPQLNSKIPSLEAEDIAASIVHIVSAPQRVQITQLTIEPLGATFN